MNRSEILIALKVKLPIVVILIAMFQPGFSQKLDTTATNLKLDQIIEGEWVSNWAEGVGYKYVFKANGDAYRVKIKNNRGYREIIWVMTKDGTNRVALIAAFADLTDYYEIKITSRDEFSLTGTDGTVWRFVRYKI